ncbi:HAD-IB family hydrolase [Montanilutibacter psychrotolerans]|uniref:HAD-IB family hydrolase n=1 Tax=Montanilutibacter psychrotolerans TaxID=1327343 RepID=A0A3M8SP28_9GAMM|nr:HAD-IB family hydrolase [Lysobacter psychrotolerans]RNF83098.1 HAD-IB family hydrolase [Lysobacter psychrotolerans]
MNLALFDFDGTITFADTYTPFLNYAVTPRRLLLGKLLLGPMYLAYKLGLLPATTMRQAGSGFGFRGRRADDVRRLGARYAHDVLSTQLRPEALERIQWHRTQGDTIVVVSASLDMYLDEWCAQHDLALICTRMEARDGVLTGRYHLGDCTGEEKARRVRELYRLDSYPVVYAYGDTHEDRQLLDLAHRRYFRWQEVAA